MIQWLLFVHLLGAVGMGFYMLLPFLAGKIGGMNGEAAAGYLRVLYGANRIAQFLLIAQLLTGGYLISQGDYSHTWMAVVIVLLVAIGALGGIAGVNMKRAQTAFAEGKPADGPAGKVKGFSWGIWLLFVVMLLLMYFPSSL